MQYKSLYPDLPVIPEQNVHGLFFSRPDQKDWPNYTAYINAATGQRRTIREFVERIRDGATALGADSQQGGLGLHPDNGEIVGILSENCVDFATLVHSLLVITVPFALLSSYYTPYELKHAITLSKATRIFASPPYISQLISAGFPEDRIYILEGNVPGRKSFQDFISHVHNNEIPRVPIRPAKVNTLAYLIFSSGTSGLPKAVMISHGNLINSLLQIFVMAPELAKVQPPQTYNTPEGISVSFAVLPMHHAFGLHMTCFRVYFVPGTIVVLPKWDADVFLDSIPKYRVTGLYLVPSLVHQLVHHPRLPSTDLSSVILTHSGAAYLPPQLASKYTSLVPSVARVAEGYGMSEATLSISSKPYPGLFEGRAKNVPGSAGILLPGVEARIVRDDGSLADVNEPGEIWVRSGCVALGYWGNERATKETFIDGWLRTGDRMRIDKDGVLYFEDRAKDILKVSGMQVSPVEIENTLLANPQRLITDATVAGVSGGRTSDERVPRAWVVLSVEGNNIGAKQAVAQLDKWIRDTLSKYKWLRGGIEIVDQIPKSPTGKVLRRVLQEQHQQRQKSSEAKL